MVLQRAGDRNDYDVARKIERIVGRVAILVRIIGTDAQPRPNIEVRADAGPAVAVGARYTLKVGVDIGGEDACQEIALPVMLPARAERGIDGKDSGALRIRGTVDCDEFDRRVSTGSPTHCCLRGHA